MKDEDEDDNVCCPGNDNLQRQMQYSTRAILEGWRSTCKSRSNVGVVVVARCVGDGRDREGATKRDELYRGPASIHLRLLAT